MTGSAADVVYPWFQMTTLCCPPPFPSINHSNVSAVLAPIKMLLIKGLWFVGYAEAGRNYGKPPILGGNSHQLART
jgi:hypothetical protein